MISTSRNISCAVARGLFCSFVLAAFSAATVQQSVAALFTLTDDNSIAQFEPAAPANNFNWFVDGNDILAQQAFWYRTGSAGPEFSLHTLPIAVQGTTD